MKTLKESLLDDENILLKSTNSEKIMNFPKIDDYKYYPSGRLFFYYWKCPILDDFVSKIDPMGKYLVLSWGDINFDYKSNPNIIIYLGVGNKKDPKDRLRENFCILHSDLLNNKIGQNYNKRINFMYEFLKFIKNDISILETLKNLYEHSPQHKHLDFDKHLSKFIKTLNI